MSRIYISLASILLAIGVLLLGREWFAKTVKEIVKDL